MGFYSPAILIKDAQRHGLRVLPVDVAISDWPCTVENRNLRLGLRYARGLGPDVRAVYVALDPATTNALRAQWDRWGQGAALAVLDSPYRSLLDPLLDYIEQIQRDDPSAYVTVILPEFVPRKLWQHLLHNQHALLIKGALLFKPNVVVTSVPFHLGRRAAAEATVGIAERAEVGAAAPQG